MTKDELVKGLNEDLAGEFQAVIMYVTYAATVTGPHRPMLKQFFEGEIPEELGHAQFLAEKISSYGGTPTVTLQTAHRYYTPPDAVPPPAHRCGAPTSGPRSPAARR